jgi:hypothetical protein
LKAVTTGVVAAIAYVWLNRPNPRACFEAMVGHACAIRAHTQETCPNGQTLQILFTAFASEGNCRKSRRAFFFLLMSSLIFEMPIPGGSAKKLWCLFFGAYCMVFSKNMFCSTVAFRKSPLFCLLKSY